MNSFLAALAVLSIVPVFFPSKPSVAEMARSRFWYPLVGLLLGALLGGWMAIVAQLHAPVPGAFLVLLAWVGLTGALHLDGLCDLCDGLFGAGTPEERLRIMKDPHTGTFGLAAGALLLLGKFACLQTLLLNPRGPWIVATAVLAARCLALSMAAGARYPRREGTGKVLIEALKGWEGILFAGIAGVTMLSSVALADLPQLHAPSQEAVFLTLAVLAAALLCVLSLGWLCRRRLGGITGDCLGAAIEMVELVICLLPSVLGRQGG